MHVKQKFCKCGEEMKEVAKGSYGERKNTTFTTYFRCLECEKAVEIHTGYNNEEKWLEEGGEFYFEKH